MRCGRGAATVLAALALLGAACSVEEDGGQGDDEGGSGGSVAASEDLTEGGTWDDSQVTETAADLDCGLSADDPTRGVTDTSVKVGGLITASGPTTALFTDAEAGARARFERANAEGGVHGRTIDFVGAEDDGL
ncbi:MAG TPA: ABC transporter substrate-binding protein, partial [Acidimicrobiales bacterium]